MSIASRWQNICTQIANIQQPPITTPLNKQHSGENHPATNPTTRIVSTVAVSKRQAVDFIQQAYNAGARTFAESFLQEALPKMKQLTSLNDIVWHFIGPIQSNKAQSIAVHFDWVQSVSREKIARRLSLYRPKNKKPLNILLQVNISQETSKSGLSPDQVEELADVVESLPQLRLRGLMCIPAKTDNPAEQTKIFEQMFQLFERISKQYPEIDTLSMGMSNDYQAAVRCGSNMVRIGSALFGAREKS